MALLSKQTSIGTFLTLFGAPQILPSAIAPQIRPLQTVLASIALPTISIPIPGLLIDLWEGILKAVPKKKTSHSKRRHRQLAGKALKDVKNINSCPGCGRPKKAHFLCPFCVAEIKAMWAPSRYIAPTKRKSTPQKFYDQSSFAPKSSKKNNGAPAGSEHTESQAAPPSNP